MPLSGGQTFASYKIVRLLGSGGMGEVYLAEHPRLPRRDALKVLPAEISADPDYRARFNREADLASKLWHPHIVSVHDRGEYDGQLWISMDYVDGLDAARLLATRHPAGMPADDVVRIVTTVASALDYAHKQGLLHRDVKPANIMLTRIDDDEDEQRVLLADFGIARNVDDISGLTATNMTVGTVAYAAPEQLMGEELDGRADEYALAATAYHLLSGSHLFPHSNPAVIISHHLNSPPPALADTHPGLAALDPVLARALAKNPDDRFPRCSDFARALAEPSHKHKLPSPVAVTKPAPVPRKSTAGVPPTGGEPPHRAAVSSSRRRWLMATAALAVILLASVIALAWRPWERGKSTGTTTSSRPPLAVSNSSVPPPPPVTTPQPVDPRLSGPPIGSDCSQAQWNDTKVSREGTSVRCIKDAAGKHTWQGDSGQQLDPSVIAQIGWEACNKQYTPSSCVAAAQEIVGAPSTSVPVMPDGTWAVPSFMNYGHYAAVVGPSGTCWWYGYDNHGTIVDSGRYTSKNDKPQAYVTPMMVSFQTVGCTPWVMMKPLEPDW